MELFLRLGIFFFRVVDWLLSPVFFFYSFYPIGKVPAVKNSDIVCENAYALARKIRTKQITCERVVKAFVERCKETNVVLNAIVEDRFVEALVEARGVDTYLKTLDDKSSEELEMEVPLLGIPFTCSESCSVTGMSFSVGSKPREGIRADKDGEAVSLLRKGGAIPIAVTNTPELCASYETNNYVTGFTRNPYDRHRTVGGASGAEGALISCAASVIGLGTDFGGSLRISSMFNGIFSHKPTPGLVPLVGHFPYMSSGDFLKYFSIGPLARYAKDLKLLLQVLAGNQAHKMNLDTPVTMKEIKIYYVDKGFQSVSLQSPQSDISKAIVKCARYFHKHHSCSIQKVQFSELKDSYEICLFSLTTMDGLKTNFQYFSKSSNSSTDVFKAFWKISDYTLDYALLKLFIDAKGFISEGRKKFYSKVKDALVAALTEMLGDNGVLFYPTFPTPAFYRRRKLHKMSGLHYATIFNVLGFPATHVPIELNKQKLPIGFQVVAAPMQDRLCLAVAEHLESAFGGWISPPMK